jgi:hypothetical protein
MKAGAQLRLSINELLTRVLLAVLVSAGMVLVARDARAAGTLYEVELDTTAVMGQPGALEFVVTSPRGMVTTGSIRNFHHDGIALDDVETAGHVEGGLVNGDHLSETKFAATTYLSLDEDRFLIRLYLPFTSYGTFITFSVELTPRYMPPDGSLPDELAFYLFDSAGEPLFSTADQLGSDAIFGISANGTSPGYPEVFEPAFLENQSLITLEVPVVCSGTSTTGQPCASDDNPCTFDVCNSAGQCTHPIGNAGVICRAALAKCDVSEMCTGTSASCPADLFVSSTTVCRAAAGVCDVPERCTGGGPFCPSNSFSTTATICREAAGICDAQETCSGVSATCPSNTYRSTGTVCRVAVSICDVPETCSGTFSFCPGNAFAPSSTPCRQANGVCDKTEYCPGSTSICPVDTFLTTATPCRTSAGVCDVEERCSGSAASCPANSFSASTVACRTSAGSCDIQERCTGTAASCPSDLFIGAGVVCRTAGTICDSDERCSGSAAMCPSPDAAICPSACPLTPMNCSSTIQRAKLSFYEKEDRKRLKFSGRQVGDGTLREDLGYPESDSTHYFLCAYSNSLGRVFDAKLDPGTTCRNGDPCWSSGTKDIQYRDRRGEPTADGISKAQLKANTTGLDISLMGDGPYLDVPDDLESLRSDQSVVFQIIKVGQTPGAARCWAASMTYPYEINDSQRYSAKSYQ